LTALIFIEINKADTEPQPGGVMSHDALKLNPLAIGKQDLKKQHFADYHFNNGVYITTPDRQITDPHIVVGL